MFTILITTILINSYSDESVGVTHEKIGSYATAAKCEVIAKQLRTTETIDKSYRTLVTRARCVQEN